MNNKKIVLIVVLVCFFALYISTSSAQEQLDDYPIKQETMDELSQLIDKFNDLENDITSLQIHEVETVDKIPDSLQDVLTRTCLRLYVVQSREPMTILKLLLGLEETHGLYSQIESTFLEEPRRADVETQALLRVYKNLGLHYIKGGALETGVARLDAMMELIDKFINHENQFKSISHSSFIIMSDKLKGYIRESKRLMQKIVDELENTIKVLKANESNP